MVRYIGIILVGVLAVVFWSSRVKAQDDCYFRLDIALPSLKDGDSTVTDFSLLNVDAVQGKKFRGLILPFEEGIHSLGIEFLDREGGVLGRYGVPDTRYLMVEYTEGGGELVPTDSPRATVTTPHHPDAAKIEISDGSGKVTLWEAEPERGRKKPKEGDDDKELPSCLEEKPL